MISRLPAAALLVLVLGLGLAAVAYAHWDVPPAEAARKSPLEPTPATVAAGQAIYQERCVNCHGPEGRGDGPAATTLPEKPEDLTEGHVQKDSDGALFWKVTVGKKPMPSYRTRLSDEQRWQVIAYVRELGRRGGMSRPPAPAGAAPSAASGH